MIDRRKLKYNKDHLDLKTFLILEVNFKAENNIYQGTIIDGKLLRLENKSVFICNDCYQLFGNSILSQKLDIKYQTLDKIIASQMSSNPIYNFDFKINKLYDYNKLDELINKIIPSSKLPINGIVFYPKVSGTILIYSEKNNSNNSNINKNNFNNTNKNNFNTNQVTNFKINNISSDESYHIVRDLSSYLISRTSLSKEDLKNYKQKELTLRKSDIPDVYFLYEDENKPQIGIANIPNLNISHKLNILFENNITQKILCYYNKLFKKWTPII